MKKRCVTRLLALCLALCLASPAALGVEASDFTDVSAGDWFYDSVDYVAQKGLMAGTGGGLFQPETVCDRAMFVTVLHRMENTPAAEGAVFLDVPGDAYYTAAVAWASAGEIVKGYGDGRFGPNDPITREQMLLMLYRYAEGKGYDVSDAGDLSAFPDAGEVSDYARRAVEWGVARGLMMGTGAGLVDPQGLVTRAQAAAFLSRFHRFTETAGTAGGEEVTASVSRTLSDLTADQTTFVANAKFSAVFTVSVKINSDSVELCRDDGVRLGAMRDDGLNGDAVAEDGIYTCVWSGSGLPAGDYTCYARLGNKESSGLTVHFLPGGTITGRVCSAAGQNQPLEGAVLNAYLDGRLYDTAVVGANGVYSLSLPAGSYQIEIARPGFVPFRAYAVVTGNSQTYNETYLMIEGTEGEPGSAGGVITSALTGKGMADVLLEVRPGWNNSAAGSPVASVYTSENGRYALELPIGNYTVTASKEGFIPVSINIIVTAAGVTAQNGSISPVMGESSYRVVLTWGVSPSDMDSHIVGTDDQGRQFHVSYTTGPAYAMDGSILCNLDVDDTNSFGPETITLNAGGDRTYYYYVQKYSEDGTLPDSFATVRVYRGSDLLVTYNVPTGQASGTFWNVFALKNGEIVRRHTITAKPDITYAN